MRTLVMDKLLMRFAGGLANGGSLYECMALFCGLSRQHEQVFRQAVAIAMV